MASFKAEKTISSLLKKGFIQDAAHHHVFKFWHNGKLIARTFTSHNNQDIGLPDKRHEKAVQNG